MPAFIRLMAFVNVDMPYVIDKLSPDSMKKLLEFLTTLINSRDTREQYNAQYMIIHMFARTEQWELENICRQYRIEIIRPLVAADEPGLIVRSVTSEFYVRSSTVPVTTFNKMLSCARPAADRYERIVHQEGALMPEPAADSREANLGF